MAAVNSQRLRQCVAIQHMHRTENQQLREWLAAEASRLRGEGDSREEARQMAAHDSCASSGPLREESKALGFVWQS